MQIVKVMNNSLVLALDETGRECVLMGKGIGFNQAIGNPVTEEDIEKTFLLKDKKKLLDFVQLASELDEVYFNLVQEIIHYAEETYEIEVMDSLYLSLSDHISFAVERLKQGYSGENFNYVEIAKRYKEEYTIGKYAVDLINNRLGVELSNGEISSIAMHFINAKLNAPSLKKEQEIVKLVKSVETIVTRATGAVIDKESFSYSRFLTHLNYFAERIIDGQIFPDEEVDALYQSMIKNMIKEQEIINKLAEFIKSKYHTVLTKQEEIYLLIHLHRLLLGN